MQVSDIRAKASAMMPTLLESLESLVAIPSVAFPGYPSEPVDQMADETLRMFRQAGFDNARFMDVPTGYPPIYGEIDRPKGSPTVCSTPTTTYSLRHPSKAGPPTRGPRPERTMVASMAGVSPMTRAA